MGIGDAYSSRARQTCGLPIEHGLKLGHVDAAIAQFTSIFVRDRLQREIGLRKSPLEASIERFRQILCVLPRHAPCIDVMLNKKEADQRHNNQIEADDRKRDAPGKLAQGARFIFPAQRRRERGSRFDRSQIRQTNLPTRVSSPTDRHQG